MTTNIDGHRRPSRDNHHNHSRRRNDPRLRALPPAPPRRRGRHHRAPAVRAHAHAPGVQRQGSRPSHAGNDDPRVPVPAAPPSSSANARRARRWCGRALSGRALWRGVGEYMRVCFMLVRATRTGGGTGSGRCMGRVGLRTYQACLLRFVFLIFGRFIL